MLKPYLEEFVILELRMLKTHGYVHNMSDILLGYRCHDEQVTNGSKTKDKGGAGSHYWKNLRNKMIDNLING